MNQEELNAKLLETVSFHSLINETSLEKLKALLELGADVKVKNNQGKNLIHMMCSHIDDDTKKFAREYVEYLIDLKVDVNEPDDNGWMAISNGKFVDILLRAGARLDIAGGAGMTPLLAVIYGINTNDEQKIGQVVNMFLEYGADVNAADVDGGTPLMYAVESLGYFGEDVAATLVRMLMENGADIYFKNNKGQTFSDIFVDKYDKAKEQVERYGEDIDLQNYVSIDYLSKIADRYYTDLNDIKQALHVKVYDAIRSFSKDISMLVTDYAVVTIKEFLNDNKEKD